MIIWITGPSASGKSTINYKVIEGLGAGYKNKKHFVPFYSFDDIIAIGRYITPGKQLNGTDGIMVGKDKLKNFIDIEYSNWRHMLIDGNKFVNEEIFDYLTQYDLKIFYINPPMHLILERSKKRNNGWDKKITIRKRQSEREKYNKLMHDAKYKKYIEIRENLNMKESDNIAKEILNIFKPTKCGILPI